MIPEGRTITARRRLSRTHERLRRVGGPQRLDAGERSGVNSPSVSGKSDRLYERHVARAITGNGQGEDLFIHFGHFDAAVPPEISDAAFQVGQRVLDDHLIGLARLVDGLRVVDVGCGVGGTLAHIDAAFNRMDLHGVNIDPRQIAAARGRVVPRGTNRLTWHIADALALPFIDAAIDRVLAIECVPHFGSRARFLAEAARILVDGGGLALSDFVPTAALRARRDRDQLPAGFASAVDGLTPFEDFWGDEPGYDALAAAASLVLVERIDATAATLPTYRFFLRDEPDRVLALATAPAVDRGIAALGWAQARGLLRMEYLAFRRVPR